LICDETKPYASDGVCYPLDSAFDQPWSLSEVFGRPIKGSCPLTETDGEDSEAVCLNISNQREVYSSPGAIERKNPGGFSRCYKILGISKSKFLLETFSNKLTIHR
jgi:phosphatidylinositol glycan class T